MITFDGFSACVTQVGADQQLAAELHELIGSKPGWTLESASDFETARASLRCRDAFVVILCIVDEISHAHARRFLAAMDPTKTPTIVVYDHLSPSELLELLRRGAVECLGRPLNLTRLSLILDLLVAPKRVAVWPASQSPPRADAREKRDIQQVGLSERLMDQVRAVAPLDTTILITGETGAGKTRLSRLIHALSHRRDKPFLAVNCGALLESLLDSDLFGHVKGSFTGADRDHTGKLEQCRDGTLLLDEIDTLSAAAQIKLLQVAEERVFQPVGATEFKPLRARLIVASNKSLESEVSAGRFRSDLYYRLNVMSFQLPPLRERRHEIRRLVEEFAVEFASHHNLGKPTITAESHSALESYAWPGNIRELRNVVERAVILAGGASIDPSHLPAHVVSTSDSDPHDTEPDHCVDLGNRLAHARGEAERAHLLQALQRNKNNRTKTAAYLGISRVALYKRLRKFQIR